MRVIATTMRWDNGATTITTGKATAQVSGQLANHAAVLSILIPRARKDEIPEMMNDIIPDIIRLKAGLAKRGGIICSSHMLGGIIFRADLG